jgi:hypothetical protein
MRRNASIFWRIEFIPKNLEDAAKKSIAVDIKTIVARHGQEYAAIMSAVRAVK